MADGAKPRSRHQDRFQILQSERRHERIYRSYHVLYDLAHVARYSADPQRWISPDQVKAKVLADLLYPIEGSVRKLLAERTAPVPMPAHTPIVFPQ